MSQAVLSVRRRRLIESYLLNVAFVNAGVLGTPPAAESQERRSAEAQDSEIKVKRRAVECSRGSSAGSLNQFLNWPIKTESEPLNYGNDLVNVPTFTSQCTSTLEPKTSRANIAGKQ